MAFASACGGGESSGGSPGGLTGNGTGGSETGGSATGGSAATPSTDGTGGDVDVDSGQPASDAADEPVPCGAEKQACCNDTTCTDPSLTCADHFCLVCNALPAPPGCTNVARGVVPTAQQTNPNNPLAYATDGSSCTAWASGDYANIADSGLTGTWFELDLGSTHTIDSMMLWMEQTPPDVMVRLKIETSADAATWVSFRDPAEFTMLLHANDPWVTPFHDAQDRAIALRFLKITFLDSESWISIRELSLFECPSSAGM